MTVSRAAGKLEAALERFDLGGAVRGARAVDVGASTGGFTETLLAHGAAHVTAVDVGHGQLAARLLADARVTSMEDVDWKRLSLGEAAGPFDFFTVDVSFVAARNMLRGLAFRLRPGARGIVLVKPQFELAARQVRDGRVDDESLRLAAVEKVRRKAETLGFTMLAHADSPVAGGSGTVEILALLRFEGRPASLPQPGERRASPARAAPARRAVMPEASAEQALRWFAVVAPGLEEVAAREVAALPGVADAQTVAGGVTWTGDLACGYRANLWLRIATRVLARAGEVEATEFGKLRHRLARLRWQPFVPPGASLTVRAATRHCRLYHTGAIAETVALAVADAVPGAHLAKGGESAVITLLARGEDDRFTLSVDASGERLHRRGARLETGTAPLRETLAAGMLALAGWRPDEPLCDPMCGAGTIPLEACAIALDVAPGLARPFALDAWPTLASQPDLARALRDEARARTRPEPPAPILASDRKPETIAAARRNAARAGMDDKIVLSCADIAQARPGTTPGLVVLNPPYGHRLRLDRALSRSLRDLGRALRAGFSGWRAAVLVPARADTGWLGFSGTARFPLDNGGLAVALVTGRVL